MLKRIKSNIFLKIFLSIFSILTLASFLIYGIVVIATPEQYKAQVDERFSENTVLFIRQLKQSTRKDADKLIVDFCIDNQAVIILQGGGEKLEFGKEPAQDNNGGLSAVQGLTVPVQFTDTDISYAMQISQSAKVVNEMMVVFRRLFPWIVLIILLIAAMGSFLCSRILASPVLNISRISKRMSELDMTWRCDVNRTDELGVLANSLNVMALKLDSAMTELETANSQLKEDIEKKKKQEKQLQAFFAAVSHELKTPITILKGQVESMILGIGDFKNKEKYLPMTLETIERMENLVKEILTISRLASDDFKPLKRSADLSVLLQECLNLYRPLALKKCIQLDCVCLESVTLEIDRRLFEKALSNIISNAILYSPEGAHVTISLTQSLLSVENTGVQIPEEKRTDLFAPLTRVEESRNKGTGGSGLGLYIVKTILDLHSLSCDIQNSENGVRFTINIHQSQN